MTVTVTIVIKSKSNAHFWVLQITRFLLIYNKPFNQFKFRILVFKVYRKIFLIRIFSHVTRKRKKEEICACVIQLVIVRAKKRKFFMSEYWESYPRVILIVWTFPDLPISWMLFLKPITNAYMREKYQQLKYTHVG